MKSQLEGISEWLGDEIKKVVPAGVEVVNEWQKTIDTQIQKNVGALDAAVTVYRPIIRHNAETDKFDLQIQVEISTTRISDFNGFAIGEEIGVALHNSYVPEENFPRFWNLRMRWTSIIDGSNDTTTLTFESEFHLKNNNK